MSNTIDTLTSERDTLYVAGNFVVAITTLRDPILEADIQAYGIYNTDTGVREAEARRLANAKDLCDSFAPAQAELPLTHATAAVN